MNLLDIGARYLAGESTSTLARHYNIPVSTLRRQLVKAGISLRPVGTDNRRYRVDQTFFDTIDTEEKAYWLGFLWADGHNAIPKRSLVVRLSVTDRGHLDSFKAHLRSAHPIVERTDDKGHRSVYITIGSAHMCRSLERHGMQGDKTYQPLHFPTIASGLVPLFVRGYFDGDGSFICPQTKHASIEFTGNLHFLAELQKVIQQHSAIQGRLRTHNDTYGALVFTGRKRVKTLAEWLMASRGDIGLTRKRERYEQFCAIT